jgi:hypothetical protein
MENPTTEDVGSALRCGWIVVVVVLEALEDEDAKRDAQDLGALGWMGMGAGVVVLVVVVGVVDSITFVIDDSVAEDEEDGTASPSPTSDTVTVTSLPSGTAEIDVFADDTGEAGIVSDSSTSVTFSDDSETSTVSPATISCEVTLC